MLVGTIVAALGSASATRARSRTRTHEPEHDFSGGRRNACQGGLTVSAHRCRDEHRQGVELPIQYFRLMEAELPLIERRLVTGPAADLRALAAQGRLLPGAVMAAAVLYSHAPSGESLAGRPRDSSIWPRRSAICWPPRASRVDCRRSSTATGARTCGSRRTGCSSRISVPSV